MIDAKTKLCCIIGNSVEHSLSPRMHNAGYEALGLNFSFVAFPVINLKDAVAGVRALNIHGAAVTIPHKIEVMQYLDEIDETAQAIGAVNTIVNENGKLKGTNTDWIGAVKALEEITSIDGKNVALIGAGGAARAIAYGLKKRGANVSVFNRTKEKAEQLVKDFGLYGSYKLDEIDKSMRPCMFVNATSVGMTGYSSESPIPASILTKENIVFDIVYNPKETQLIRDAKKAGAKIVYGYKMLLYQAVAQFDLFTENKAPVELMEKALLSSL